MSEWLNKCSVGSLVFSGLLGLGVAVHYRSKVTIAEHLNSMGLPILTKGSHEWGNVFKQYQKEKSTLRISDLESENWSNLRDWCLNKSKEYFSHKNKDLFFKISAWCTHPYTISGWIEHNKNRSLIKDPLKKPHCETNKDKHFKHEEDQIYLQFIKDCTTLITDK
ncbi:hypothetical protein A6V39_00930 [Candidatus Mycoplasma haematobovis]|uniref:Uncharacterized protein n=1 Tax=Candidatus Mycoplasma haematobovis TaxID=432608 RepID=A0A1A9QF90_9MOLU|nr:hypothetical protein [Candidatus Mycoplasma haematobovis]OAL10616.1 hypothetical protein A6V39_00930 [Candidatus Mycoplasma haematobovis]